MSDDNVSYGPMLGTPCIVMNCLNMARMSTYIWNHPLAKQAKHDFCQVHGPMVQDLISAHNKMNVLNRQELEIKTFEAADRLEIQLNEFFLTGILPK